MGNLSAIQTKPMIVLGLFQSCGIQASEANGIITINHGDYRIQYDAESQLLKINSTRFHRIDVAKAIEIINALEVEGE